MPEPKASCRPADRRVVLEAIARVLRGGALSDPDEDLAAWVTGVEIVEVLGRAGFHIIRHQVMPVEVMLPEMDLVPDAGEQRH